MILCYMCFKLSILEVTSPFIHSCLVASSIAVVVQLLSRVQLFMTPRTVARQPSRSFTISLSLLRFRFIESVMLYNHLILCCPLLHLPSAFPSIRVFPNESTLCIRWSKYWSFSFSISLSNRCSGLISFRIAWFDLLAVQGTLQSLLQNHSLKASILWRSAFFMVQLSHQYMTTGKTIALNTWTFVGKVMSLLFNTLSRFCHSFSSKEQVSFNFTVAVTISSDSGAQENKICHFFHFSPFSLP